MQLCIEAGVQRNRLAMVKHSCKMKYAVIKEIGILKYIGDSHNISHQSSDIYYWLYDGRGRLDKFYKFLKERNRVHGLYKNSASFRSGLENQAFSSKEEDFLMSLPAFIKWNGIIKEFKIFRLREDEK